MSSSLHLDALVKVVLNNLENQQDWTDLQIYSDASRPRPLISGLPPRRLYVHPDEQIEIIKAETTRGGERIPQPPEHEWILPIHLAEKLSLSAFAAVFDSIEAIPPGAHAVEERDYGEEGAAQWMQWRGPKRGKRLLLATVQDDSTVVYYLMHDGIVKPRQN
ncbi:hypothetical protein NKR23_g2331 [Pleurostoma richardsiae]|uniref:tRNA-splicing endonuclease subunit Sen15 domain-containing protein n=1 Tax=Pleurostoma richardsiae TaxID=41990 RepID=A0AA38VUX6_9PEZI|nr:hypothetical protein NKR23_g2331 [Pleurostoma richardsiae]